MKPFRCLIIVWIFAAFTAAAGEPVAEKAKDSTNPSTAADLQSLQGKWEGGVVGNKADEKITVTITGNSFHFHRDTNFWFETTITLPAGTEPKQLLATIKNCPTSQADSIGKVVGAIFKIEGEKLTVATGGSDSSPEGTPKSFEAAEDKGMTRYELQRVQSRKDDAKPRETK